MFKIISLAFGRTPKLRTPDMSIDPDMVRSIVSSHSHGNVRLQDGRYYTSADVDAEYEAVRGIELTA